MIMLMLWLHFGQSIYITFEAEPDPDAGNIWLGDEAQTEILC